MVIWSFEGRETRYRSKPERFENHVIQFAETEKVPGGTAIVFHNGFRPGKFMTHVPGEPLTGIDLSSREGLEQAKKIMNQTKKPKGNGMGRSNKK